MQKKTWIDKTNQTWKLNAAMAFMIVAFALLAMAYVAHSYPGNPWVAPLSSFIELFIVIAVLTAAVGMGIIFYAIQCPKCGKKPFRPLAEIVPYQEVFTKFFYSEKCPLCNDTGEPMQKDKSKRIFGRF
ncbi:hypothetical protein [Desulfatibacillum aliphaticivorans]|uniref:hypothetical protein n=1 Tax=Desulfatibacillum aliphaticivorans TaxID=218208 RepID=UPI00040C1259|nr:hypothetical protein [Desulfatibacillum aliphaticivorans]